MVELYIAIDAISIWKNAREPSRSAAAEFVVLAIVDGLVTMALIRIRLTDHIDWSNLLQYLSS